MTETRQKRVKQTAEIFTPPALTNEILDKLPLEVWEPEKTFCDPACGNGNILLEVLIRKLSYDHPALVAVRAIWGVDLMPDNVIECRERLLELIPEIDKEEARKLLKKQIACHDALTWDFNRWKEVGTKYKKLI